MLAQRLELHDIRDTEGFITSIVAAARLNLRYHDNEDLRAYLIEETWILSTRYQPGGLRFSTWARNTLQRRIIDWQRRTNGDHRYPSGRLPRPTPLPDHAPTQTHRDPLADRDAHHLVRVLRARGSDEAWRTHQRDQTLPHRAA